MTSVGVRELYSELRVMAQERAGSYSKLDVLVRLREGFKAQHSTVVLCLFWWHLFLNDRSLYNRLKSATDEISIRQLLGGRVMTEYIQGEKTVILCSDLFPDSFFEIIDAYLEYTDRLSGSVS